MTIINTRTPLGGALYPFLHRLNQRWAIISHAVTEPATRYPQEPVLRWVNDNHVQDLYVEDMDTASFLEATGLELSLAKGGYVLSKRISRLMRPYFISSFFPQDAISIHYLDQNERDAKIWDGAGQINRDLLLRLIDHLPEDITPRKRRYLEYELCHARRVEFTLMTADGQCKGHALVKDDLDTDFVLPRDIKSEVKLVDGTTFVGLVPVHSSADMRLDIQSIINLYPFFDIPQLQRWLEAEGQLFIDSVRSGDIAEAMSRIDSDTCLEEIESWYVREYYLSGGHSLWFGSIVKSTINQHLKRLNHTTLNRMRLPVPGGRSYIAVDAVGNRHVPSGEIVLDTAAATAWVNCDDWVDYMADVLGGADQDDALWVYPFTDFDGERKVLCWRSPNQVGEYIVLKPAANSEHLTDYPPADSRKLPPRIDTLQVEYLNLIDENITVGTNQSYSIAAMDSTIQRAIANKGILGLTCNVLMLAQALYGRLPQHPPAPLEQVIDASVKSGADLSAVREWCFDASEEILKSQKPIPAILQDRLSTRDATLAAVTSTDHWLDELVLVIRQHIADITRQRDELMKQTMPPLLLFQHAFDQPETLQHGARFNQLYTSALPWTRSRGRTVGSYEAARQRSTAYLEQFPEHEQSAILRGALAHYYMGKHVGADGAAWQLGKMTDDGREPGIANLTLQALREIGLLDEVTDHPEHGILTYPGAKLLEATMRLVTIVGVWFNWLRTYRIAQGQPPPERMGDVSKEDVQWAKEQVARLTQSQFCNLTLTIHEENQREIAYTPHGNLFGYVTQGNEGIVGDCLTLKYCIVQDGNLICIVS